MKTLKLRIKDKHCKVLDQLASEVNFVWNYVNDLGLITANRNLPISILLYTNE